MSPSSSSGSQGGGGGVGWTWGETCGLDKIMGVDLGGVLPALSSMLPDRDRLRCRGEGRGGGRKRKRGKFTVGRVGGGGVSRKTNVVNSSSQR